MAEDKTENLNIETAPTLPPWLQAANPTASFAQGLAMIAALRGRGGQAGGTPAAAAAPAAAPAPGISGGGSPMPAAAATPAQQTAATPLQVNPAQTGVPGYNLYTGAPYGGSISPTQGNELSPASQGGIINPQTGQVDPSAVLGLGLGPINPATATQPGGALDPSSLGQPNIPLNADISTLLDNLLGTGNVDSIAQDYGLLD